MPYAQNIPDRIVSITGFTSGAARGEAEITESLRTESFSISESVSLFSGRTTDSGLLFMGRESIDCFPKDRVYSPIFTT